MSTNVNGQMFTLLSVSTFTERLREAVADAAQRRNVPMDLVKSEVRALAGTRGNFHHWWNGRVKEPRGGGVAVVARHLGVNAPWLAKNDGPKSDGIIGASRGAWKMPSKFTALDPGEIEGILSMYMEMDSDVRGTWRRQGRDLLELMGAPSPQNPFGKAKAKKHQRQGRKRGPDRDN